MSLRKDLYDLRVFVRCIRQLRPESKSIRHFSHFNKWRNSTRAGNSPLNDQSPWITYESRRKLERLLKPDFTIFEFGAGGSSVFFSKYVKKVTTVEHDEQWLKLVENKMASLKRTNWTGYFVPPEKIQPGPIDFSDPGLFLSADTNYEGMSFEKYASAIDQYPGEHFDLVMVDGRARPGCIKKALPKVKKGGFLVIDNSERDYYLKQIDLRAMGFDLFFNDFGPGPYNVEFWQTTIWRKHA